MAAFFTSGMDSIAESPWSEVTTPVLLDWTDEKIQRFWDEHTRRELPKKGKEKPRDWRMETDNAIAAGRFEDGVEFATKLAQSTPRDWPRGTFLRAVALDRLGKSADAKASFDELVTRWLDPRPAPPPSMHPRIAIEVDELKDLATKVLGAKAKATLRRIDGAATLEDAGEFL